MIDALINATLLLASPSTPPAIRADLAMMFYHVGIGTFDSLSCGLNDPPDSELYIITRDNLQAMHGALTEILAKHGELPK